LFVTAEWLIDSEPSERFPVFTRLNAGEVMADPVTPFGASAMWHPYIFPGWANAYATSGTFDLSEIQVDSAATGAFFFGHLYVNMTSARMIGIRAGIGADAVDAMWFAGGGDAPPHVPHPNDVNEVASARMAERSKWALSTTSFPDVEEERAVVEQLRAERPDLGTLSSAYLVARARSMGPIEHYTWRGYCVATNFASLGPAVLRQLLAAGDPGLVLRLVGTAGDVDSAAPSYALWDLARLVRADVDLGRAFDQGISGLLDRLAAERPDFHLSLLAFLSTFGARGPNEWDAGADSWETHPELVLALIDRLRHSDDDAAPAARLAERAADQEVAMAEALALVADVPDGEATLRAAIDSAGRFAMWRERGKTSCIRVLHEARVAMYEVGRRLVERGLLETPSQVFMALDSELDAVVGEPDSIVGTLIAREKEWHALSDLELPVFIDASMPIPSLSSLRRRGDTNSLTVKPGEVLHGVGASAGVARGRARVVRSTGEIGDFQPGEILVAPQTDPSWTPLFMVAAGAVIDVGAMGSHAMIVSRELGIPCTAGVESASRRIPDGALLEIDGATGVVTVIEL
jgi:phosphohistidine swiveling domain-containing protein